MTDQVSRLQEQVESLFQSMNSLRSETLRLAPIQDGLLPPRSTSGSIPSQSSSIPPLHRSELPHFRQSQNAFRGPTSATFSLDVAKNTLHHMGYSPLGEAAEESAAAEEDTQQPSPKLTYSHTKTAAHKTPKDPLWEFERDEMIRLCRIHEEEVGIMYPVVPIETVISHAKSLATWMETARKNGGFSSLRQDDVMTDERTLQLKLIMCCGMVIEEHGHSERADRLFESVRPITDKRLMSDPSDVLGLPLLALLVSSTC